MAKERKQVPISLENDAIEKDFARCINCAECVRVCTDEITVQRMYDLAITKKPICINCGQCANICPTAVIHERYHYLKVDELLDNKNNKTIIFSIAPAVRAAIGEEFGQKTAENIAGKIVAALKSIGADFIFDISFGADLTVMEEAWELVSRLKNNQNLPMTTSCCPAWVKYAEIFYPELLSHLSTCKSPIAMQSSIIKTYFASKMNIAPENIIHIVIAPCTAKKSEANRKELSITQKDTDYVLTTRELSLLFKVRDIDLLSLEPKDFDSPLGSSSSAGTMFGNSGGVCEAVLRTANYFMTGNNLKENDIVFSSLRGNLDIKEADVCLGDKQIKVAVANGMKNAKILIDQLLERKCKYDFIEIMSCQGGCSGGGGQPKLTMLEINKKKNERMNVLYDEDRKNNIRFCHENQEIKNLYEDFLKCPGSNKSLELLHTKFFDKSYLLRGETHD